MEVGVLATAVDAFHECEVRPLRRRRGTASISVQQGASQSQNMIQAILFNFSNDGYIRLTLGAETTKRLDRNMAASIWQSRIQELVQIGSGNVSVSFVTSPERVLIEFTGTKANTWQPTFVIQNDTYGSSYLNGYWATSERIYARLGVGSTWLNTTQIAPSHKVYSLLPVGLGPTSGTYTIRVTDLTGLSSSPDITVPYNATYTDLAVLLTAHPLIGVGGARVFGDPLQTGQMQIEMRDAAHFVTLSIAPSSLGLVELVPSGRTVQVEKTSKDEYVITGVSWNY